MKRLMMVMGVVAMSLATIDVAKAEQDAAASDPIQAMINGNLSGVQKIKRDSRNAIVSLVVIGRAIVQNQVRPNLARFVQI